MVNATQTHGQAEAFRVFRLKSYLSEINVTGRALAARMGVTEARVSNILGGESCPPQHLAVLRAVGVPEELLPAPSLGKSGPGRRINVRNRDWSLP